MTVVYSIEKSVLQTKAEAAARLFPDLARTEGKTVSLDKLSDSDEMNRASHQAFALRTDLSLSNGSGDCENLSVGFESWQLRMLSMKKSKFSEQRFAFILKKAEDGLTVKEVCRTAGESVQTDYRWRRNYGGGMPSKIKRLQQLEEENARFTPPGV